VWLSAAQRTGWQVGLSNKGKAMGIRTVDSIDSNVSAIKHSMGFRIEGAGFYRYYMRAYRVMAGGSLEDIPRLAATEAQVITGRLETGKASGSEE